MRDALAGISGGIFCLLMILGISADNGLIGGLFVATAFAFAGCAGAIISIFD